MDSPHKLPKIPVITSFFDALKGEIAQVWVTGTFYEPKVEPVAFPSLEEALRQLDTDLPPPAPRHRPTMRRDRDKTLTHFNNTSRLSP